MTEALKIISTNKINFSQDNYWLNIDKPKGYSSAKVVAIVKRLTKAKKVGHGGTLDPFATGVLPIAVNRATKQSMAMMNCQKKYLATIKFGEFTDSDDETGNVIESSSNRVSVNIFIKNLAKFIGDISQQPSKFSAIKINGERAYNLARQGKDFEMSLRQVNISSIKLLTYNHEECEIEIECSKGTYIRTLAKDICLANKICGHLKDLKRLKVGKFYESKSISLDQLKNIININQSIKDESIFSSVG